MKESKYPLSEKFVREHIHHLCPESHIDSRYIPDVDSWLFEVSVDPKAHGHAKIKFSDEFMEDFEEILKQSDNRSSYAIRLKYYFQFQAHIDLRAGGIIPRVKVAELFLKEHRERKDWWENARIKVVLPPDLAAVIYQGLKKLDIFLSEALERLGDIAKEMEQTEKDRQRIKGIIDYYDSNDGSLDEDSASLDSLSVLKASALADILQQEILQSQADLPEAARLRNRRIYIMTRFLRGTFFLEVPMPEWIDNYVKTALDG